MVNYSNRGKSNRKKNLKVIDVEMCHGVQEPKQWTSMSLSVSDERILLTAW